MVESERVGFAFFSFEKYPPKSLVMSVSNYIVGPSYNVISLIDRTLVGQPRVGCKYDPFRLQYRLICLSVRGLGQIQAYLVLVPSTSAAVQFTTSNPG